MEGDESHAEMAVSYLAFWICIQRVFGAPPGLQLALLEEILYQTNFQPGSSLIGQVGQWYLVLVLFNRRRHPDYTNTAASLVAD